MDDSQDSLAPATPSGTTRRHLLGAASSGFALAASGLFLPDRLAEVAARAGANGGELGGRRGKDRRGRDQRKRRTHGDKKDKGQDDRPPGGPLIQYVALRAGGQVRAPNTVEFGVDFYFRNKEKLDNWSRLKSAKSAEDIQNSHADYAPDNYSIAAYFRGPELLAPVFVEVRNPLIGAPWVKVIVNCTIGANGETVGGKRLLEGGYAIGEHDDVRLITASRLKHILRIERVDDSATHKWFTATFLNA